jgi:hypothetical protein
VGVGVAPMLTVEFDEQAVMKIVVRMITDIKRFKGICFDMDNSSLFWILGVEWSELIWYRFVDWNSSPLLPIVRAFLKSERLIVISTNLRQSSRINPQFAGLSVD